MAGETRTVAATAARTSYQAQGAGAYWVFFNLTFSTTDNETADVVQAGYIAPNARVLAVLWAPTDMDTNVSPAVVHKVSVTMGSAVDIVTGLTGAQSGTSSLTPVTPTAAATTPGTSPQLVTVTSTTAAATAAAGTAVLGLLCQAL